MTSSAPSSTSAQRNEFASGHVPGAINMELCDTAPQASALPTGPLTVMCGHRERAMSALSILEAQGRTDVAVLVGERRHRRRSPQRLAG